MICERTLPVMYIHAPVRNAVVAAIPAVNCNCCHTQHSTYKLLLYVRRLNENRGYCIANFEYLGYIYIYATLSSNQKLICLNYYLQKHEVVKLPKLAHNPCHLTCSTALQPTNARVKPPGYEATVAL